jgi:biotin carboxylase
MSHSPGPREPGASQADEMVVLVRDISTAGASRIAAAIREVGAHPGMVTGPAVDGTRARLEREVTAATAVDDPTDPVAVADAVRRIAEGYKLSAVVGSSDGTVPVAAVAAERLGVGRTPASPILNARNKFSCRDVLRGHGLPVPGYALLDSAERATEVAAAVGLPAVVKPVTGTGSHLITTVHSVAELAEAYRRTVSRLSAGDLGHLYRRSLPVAGGEHVDPSRALLVESALVGPEFCVDLVVRDGEVDMLPVVYKAIMDKRFFELAFVSPAFDHPAFGLSGEREEAIRSCVESAARALGLDNTVAHVEVIDDHRLGPTIVEVNAGRPGGPGPATLYRIGAGVDTIVEMLSAHRGAAAPRHARRPTMPLASFCFHPTVNGRLAALHGLDDVEAHPDVVSITPMAEPGAVLSQEREVVLATAVVAGFLDSDDLAKTYWELFDLLQVECE